MKSVLKGTDDLLDIKDVLNSLLNYFFFIDLLAMPIGVILFIFVLF